MLMAGIQRWRQSLKRTMLQAQEAGQLRPDADLDQLTFEPTGNDGPDARGPFLRNPDTATRGGPATSACSTTTAEPQPPLTCFAPTRPSLSTNFARPCDNLQEWDHAADHPRVCRPSPLARWC